MPDRAQIEKAHKTLAHLHPELRSEIMAESQLKVLPKDTEILREGQYVKVIPLVTDGLIKVFTSHEDKNLLLYYIRPNESCIMSFAASLKNEPSKVFATTEGRKLDQWTREFPDINNLFFQQYNLRYIDLLETIHHVLFDNMDKRLHDYLREKVKLTGQNPLKMSHREIANELGTAREVISRTMKKLEAEQLVQQHSNSIEILQ